MNERNMDNIVGRVVANTLGTTEISGRDDLPDLISRTAFLAGPIDGWRSKMFALLKERHWGEVINPVVDDYKDAYDAQFEWERKMQESSDVILFWFERLSDVSCVEFGSLVGSGRVILGHPSDLEGCEYLDSLYEVEYQEKPFNSLEALADAAIERIPSTPRTGGCRFVPFQIYNTAQFKLWHDALEQAGNRLDDARQLWVFRMPKARIVFSWVLWVKVWIESEQRYKENEWVFSRSDISVGVLFVSNPHVWDTELILIREFRSPSRTSDGFIRELPGGSSKSDKKPGEVLISEVKEEVGIEITNINYVGSNQLAGTLSSHKAHLFRCELSESQFEKICLSIESGQTFGVAEDSELTTIELTTLSKVIKGEVELDFAMVGMIVRAMCPFLE